MKKYGYIFISLTVLTNSFYATDPKTSVEGSLTKEAPQEKNKNSSTPKKETVPSEKDDAFELGKTVASNLTALKANPFFTRLPKIPSWDEADSSPMWVTQPGAKVIAPRSNGKYVYGIVQQFKHSLVSVIVGKKADGSFEVEDFPVTNLSDLKWVHVSWITTTKGWLSKKTKNVLIKREKAFINYNQTTKNFQEFAI